MLQLTDQICHCSSSPMLLLHLQPTNNIFLVQNRYKAKQTKLMADPLQEEMAFVCLAGVSPIFLGKS